MIEWSKEVNDKMEYSIYTDSSKIIDKVGFGVVIVKKDRIIDEQAYRLSDNASVYVTELMGIFTALNSLIDKDYHAVNLCTDSMSSLQAIAFNSNNQLAMNIRKLLMEINLKVNLVRVKAHIGIRFNEKADELAKMGTQKAEIDFHIKYSALQIKKKFT